MWSVLGYVDFRMKRTQLSCCFVSEEASQSELDRHWSTCLKASWCYWLTFGPSVRANTNSRVSVFVQGWFPGSRSALWDGGQATRWRPDSAVRSQNDHCSVASPHVASRRVKTSCLLTTTPKQSPLWLDHICCTSTGSTHCVPTRLYLNSFFLVYYHLPPNVTFSIMFLSFKENILKYDNLRTYHKCQQL